MKNHIILFLKGMAMGIANVIPGVSGGTIALITNIYEELIISLKSFNIQALKLLFSFKIKELIEYTNFKFLTLVFGGSLVSVFSIAWIFDFFLTHYPKYIWGFFFGLILASVYYIAKRVLTWNYKTISSLIIGFIIAFSLSFLSFSAENTDLLYIFICGVIGISGMLLPGLSGSYILLIMGNYKLLLVTSIKNLDYLLLSVFCAGSLVGLISFSHLIAFLLRRYKDMVLSILSGFILGSLIMVWPWSNKPEAINRPIIEYIYFPVIQEISTLITIVFIITGISIVVLIEYSSRKISK